MKYIYLPILLLAIGCSRGAHVDTINVTTMKFACYYSVSVFQTDRRVALCDTPKECSEICAKLPEIR